MNRKKGIAVAIVLLLVLLIGGMLAYFTDTEHKENVFTLGKNIDIDLTETNWNTTDVSGVSGVPDAAEDLHPGTTLQKNPVITNSANASQAYVFIKVDVPCYDDGYIGTGTVTVDTPLFSLNSASNTGWTLLREDAPNTSTRTKTYIYYYGNATNGMTALQPGASTNAVFDSITLDSTITKEEAATVTVTKVDVYAYAIQTDGYSSTAPADIFALFT